MEYKSKLPERTLDFAKSVVRMCRSLTKDVVNFKIIDQIVRSSASIGANYLEANDCLGKKDFLHRLRISRKESKETIYWLELLKEGNESQIKQLDYLIAECIELRNILSAIITKVNLKNGT
ncbi:four helix bundle protein [Candidatus Shapirobacteria bacterium]|nr:four helix bundle protein [Candidatus Shapirobacteria bacterium]